jgi:hypothetical protein
VYLVVITPTMEHSIQVGVGTYMSNMSGLEELLQVNRCTPGRISAEIAKIFRVRQSEVGLLWVEGAFLKFLYPVEFQSAGVIPLSSSAVAARSATTKKAEYFNRFPQVPHHTVFEQIKLTDTQPLSEMPDPIQKLMSAPILSEAGEVLGVLQVCRKGMTPGIAGPDFNDDDLEILRRAARRVAVLMPELDYGRGNAPHQMLRFQRAIGSQHNA